MSFKLIMRVVQLLLMCLSLCLMEVSRAVIAAVITFYLFVL